VSSLTDIKSDENWFNQAQLDYASYPASKCQTLLKIL
jgi:hypothetical protein